MSIMKASTFLKTTPLLNSNKLEGIRRIHFLTALTEKIKQKVKVLLKSTGGSKKDHDIKHLLKKAKRFDGDEKNVMARLMKSMAPLQHFEYEKQLKIKEELCQRYELKLRNTLKHSMKRETLHPELQARFEMGGSAFTVPTVTPSPCIDDFRNKDHPVIGPGVDGKPTVGFYVVPGRFPDMDIVCGKLRSMRQQHFELMKAFVECVRSSGIPALGHVTNEKAQALGGHWRTLLVRTNEDGEMLVAVSGVQWNNPDLFTRMQEIMINFFIHGVGQSFNVKSLSFQEMPYMNPNINHFPFQLLHGKSAITEQLHGLKFHISPGSFFQVNTPGAEVLYDKVRQLCQLDKDTILLDLCCGTGTIGMILSKYVKLVIGIEEDGQAVQDATKNAKLNNVDNIAFITGTAEKRLPSLLARTVFPGNNPDIVAVVNPPRAGLGVNFIRALRNCEEIRRVVYISCKPYGPVLKNFVGLMQPPHVPDKKITGAPFLITDTAAVDMFPHTKHFELLMLCER